jgi:hypothetical protein
VSLVLQSLPSLSAREPELGKLHIDLSDELHVDLSKVNVQVPGGAASGGVGFRSRVERAGDSHGSVQCYTENHEQKDDSTRVGDMRIKSLPGGLVSRDSGFINVVGDERDSDDSI